MYILQSVENKVVLVYEYSYDFTSFVMNTHKLYE